MSSIDSTRTGSTTTTTNNTLLTTTPPSPPATSVPVCAPAPAPSGNDNAAPKTIRVDPRSALVAPELVAAVEGTLLHHGIARAELPDQVAEVQLRALQATHGKPLPVDLAAWTALCCVIAERMVFKDREREQKRSRWNAGPCEAPDDHVPVARSPARTRDPVDVRRQIEVLLAQIDAGEMPEHGETILFRTADGVSAREIGQELGISSRAVERRLSLMRRLFKGKLAALGLLLLVLLD